MANSNHLAFLDHGVEASNAARRAAPEGLPDLASADLSHRSLAGINFSAADLRGANRQGCDLEGADLSDAWLEGADFSGARLAGARLSGARLTQWRLDGAVLAEASQHLGSAEQLAVLLRGADAWYTWRQENRDETLDLPEDSWLAKLVRTQRSLSNASARTRFEGNDQHLAMLGAGVEYWNAWRTDNPDVAPDLRGANLSAASLDNADLSFAKLDAALLAGAAMRFANLTGADLREAHLCWADLGGATLIGAALIRANLTGANLRGANLDLSDCAEANLTGALLDRTKLNEALLEQADFFEGNALQLATLYESGSRWNAWRQQNPDVVPDLREPISSGSISATLTLAART
jgi:uncharacterized protein YjbI with pentapeptide repeats